MVTKKRILIAEGDAALLQSATDHFRNAGWDLVVARDASNALTTAKGTRPDVIVINSSLPGGGMMALTRLKSNINTASIPVVTVTAIPEVYQKAGAQKCMPDMTDFEALEQAADGCISSPAPVEQAPRAVLQDETRLAALKNSGMLDTPPNQLLDAITRLAAGLVKVPAALVSMVDADRQFFKSQVGLKAPWSTERQTRLSHSFCQWVVAGNEPLVIGDAREHPVLVHNHAVRDLGVVAYMGVPVEASGQPIGSFCTIDTTPRQWSPDDLQTLRELACVVETFSLPPDAPRTQALGVLAKALGGARWVLEHKARTLQNSELASLWQVVSHLGQRLTVIATAKP